MRSLTRFGGACSFQSWAVETVRRVAQPHGQCSALLVGVAVAGAMVGCKSGGTEFRHERPSGGESRQTMVDIAAVPAAELARLQAAHGDRALPLADCQRFCRPGGNDVESCRIGQTRAESVPALPPSADPIDPIVGTGTPLQVATDTPAPPSAEQVPPGQEMVDALHCQYTVIFMHPAGRGDAPCELQQIDQRSVSHHQAWLAETAQREAASVLAFRRLSVELAGLGHSGLADRCVTAASEEQTHADLLGELVRRYQAEPVWPRPTEAATRSLLHLVTDNLIEGCIREAFGALVAAYQVTQPTAPGVGAAMQVIASDEAEHAELSMDIQRTLWPALTPSERAEARAQAQSALIALGDDCNMATEVSSVGHPGRQTMQHLFAEFSRAYQACDLTPRLPLTA